METVADNTSHPKNNSSSLLAIPYRLLKVDLDMSTERPVSNFLASTLRGGFGYTLRRLVCLFRDKACADCMMRGNCAYGWLFESSPSADAPRLKNYRSIPRPFAIRPSQQGNRVTLDLLLVGDAVRMLPVFIHTLNELGKRGIGKDSIPFTVQKVTTESGEDIYHSSLPDSCRAVEPNNLDVTIGGPHEGSLTLEFLSPVVMRRNGTVTANFLPDAFITTLLRRVTNLNAFYGVNRDADIDPSPWITAMDALSVDVNMGSFAQSRFSTRQKRTIDYSGLTGSVFLKGEIGTLLPLLRAGEILGVGKNTVFGYGVYRVTGN